MNKTQMPLTKPSNVDNWLYPHGLKIPESEQIIENLKPSLGETEMDLQNFLNIFLEREVLKNLKEGHDVLIKASKYRTE